MTSNCFAEGPDYTVLLLPEPVGFGLGGRGVFFFGGGVGGVDWFVGCQWCLLQKLTECRSVASVTRNSQNADLWHLLQETHRMQETRIKKLM